MFHLRLFSRTNAQATMERSSKGGIEHLLFRNKKKTKMLRQQMHKLMTYKLASISIADTLRAIRLLYRGGSSHYIFIFFSFTHYFAFEFLSFHFSSRRIVHIDFNMLSTDTVPCFKIISDHIFMTIWEI